jgi:hypothetical protein
MTDSFEKKVGFADHAGTVAEVSVDREDVAEDEEAEIHVKISAGYCQGAGFPTVEAARQLAAALLNAAEVAEGHS